MLSRAPLRVAGACLLLGVPPLLLAVPRPRGEPIAIRSRPTALSPGDPGVKLVGGLEFRGGLVLRSKAKSFGGFSGLHVSADGLQLTTVTDKGEWFSARLVYDDRGRLQNLTGAEMGPLRDGDGRRLEDGDRDAEALAELAGGGLAVAFERRHRIWSYPQGLDAPADPLPTPDGLQGAPENGGVESLVTLADGRLLALTQRHGKHRLHHGWIWSRGKWTPVKYRARADSNPTDATLLPSGDLLVLELGESDQGSLVRLQRLPKDEIDSREVLEGETLLELRRPLPVDKFEGVACRAGEGGESLIYMISDDDFDKDRRTVLLMFALGRQSDLRREP